MTLEITTKIGCSNRCIYCPQDKLIHSYEGKNSMSFLNFVQILDNTPQHVQIDFTGFCEPFLNPLASLMMSVAIKKGHVTVLYTTLEGFTNYDCELLKGHLFREVVFHEYEGAGFDKLEFDRKMKLFKDNIPYQATRHVILEDQWRLSRGSNLWDVPYQKGSFKCMWGAKDFSRNVVLPNGDVYICCMDYSLKNKIGNLLTTKYENLDRQKLIDMSNQEDSDIICRKCELFQPCSTL